MSLQGGHRPVGGTRCRNARDRLVRTRERKTRGSSADSLHGRESCLQVRDFLVQEVERHAFVTARGTSRELSEHIALFVVDVVAIRVGSERQDGQRSKRITAYRDRDTGRLQLRFEPVPTPYVPSQA